MAALCLRRKPHVSSRSFWRTLFEMGRCEKKSASASSFMDGHGVTSANKLYYCSFRLDLFGLMLLLLHASWDHDYFLFACVLIRNFLQRIPRKFVRRYGHGMSSPVVLQDPSGAVWKVGLIKSEGCMWLQNGWKEFAEHYSIKYGHFVVFRYEGNCKFHVIIFDMSASEIEYPQTSKSHGEDCDQVENFRQPKEEEAKDDISVEILREIPQSRKKRQKSPLPCSWPCKKVKTTLTNGITKSSNCSSSLAVKSRGKRVKPKKSLEADTKCDPHKLCAAKESMVLKTNENKNDAPMEILDDLPSQKTLQKSSLCSSRSRKNIRNNPCGNRESTSKLPPLPRHSRYKDTQSTRMKLEKSMKKECMDNSMKKYGGSLKFSTKDDGTRRKPTQRCKKAKVRPSSSQEERTKALFKFKNPFFRLVMQQSYISSDSLEQELILCPLHNWKPDA
ncbi:hypothetical protein SLEP1_g11956 [Rubroshorea leprosula]|nr:hypothetical protein SLEP1_g11956 [Rubroshorea leprosula]